MVKFTDVLTIGTEVLIRVELIPFNTSCQFTIMAMWLLPPTY